MFSKLYELTSSIIFIHINFKKHRRQPPSKSKLAINRQNLVNGNELFITQIIKDGCRVHRGLLFNQGSSQKRVFLPFVNLQLSNS